MTSGKRACADVELGCTVVCEVTLFRLSFLQRMQKEKNVK